MIIQFFISILSIIAVIGGVRRFGKGAISRWGFIFWLIIWIGAIILVWNPWTTNRLAGWLGVGRGADAVFYVAIMVLFYAIFRLHGKMENIEHQLSELVKKIALRDFDNRK